MTIDARNQAVRVGTNGAPPMAFYGGGRPGTTDAIRAVLLDAPQRTMTTKEIMQELDERDWLPEAKDARKAVGATISRMVNRTRELEPAGRARYRLREAREREPDNVTRALMGAAVGSVPKATVSNRLFTGSADGDAESKGA